MYRMIKSLIHHSDLSPVYFSLINISILQACLKIKKNSFSLLLINIKYEMIITIERNSVVFDHVIFVIETLLLINNHLQKSM